MIFQTLLISAISLLAPKAEGDLSISISSSEKTVTINGTVLNSKSKYEDYTAVIGSADRQEKLGNITKYVYDEKGLVLEKNNDNNALTLVLFLNGPVKTKEPKVAFAGTVSIDNVKITGGMPLTQIQAKTSSIKWTENAGAGIIFKDKTFVLSIDAKDKKADHLSVGLNIK